MKTLVILAHPDIDKSRINKAWINRLKQEENITIHDLYRVYGDNPIDVEKEHKLMEEHDRIVFEFPFYWYSAPYLLKKWQDEILTYGWAYGSTGNKLHGKDLMLAISVGGSKELYTAGGRNEYSLSELTKPFQGIAIMTGMRFVPTFALYGVMKLTDNQVLQSAEDLVKHINKEF